ncbi:KAP family P-loop domain-containing protein [Flavobacterium resistens]|uniref:KAP family P-loop domain-containing protein n=1 Tax=Flavobacterium resistens TaxID=443612 RepID=A0A521CT85_9FLAO|nr:P-loop NTPase fold protein [Flavobacterium resistens]MRX66959.1 hypothetical protein [Flavobacterium resistens]SMO62656.1 KAP family P-loop domain-containing protein [Flavobacterium resistens]
MNSDLPLVNSEDDKLGRFSFATEIASGLVKSFKDNNESIVLGINGNWGSGKSTLINFIISEIERLSDENSSKIIVLRFNPWMFSGQKELQSIFLKELILKLENNKEKLKGISTKIADFLVHLNWLKYVHSGAGEIVADAKTFLEGLGKEKDVSKLKEDIDQILIKADVKLYITIDDIDRLTPSEITDIFQLVKLNGNFANTVFILAYDQGIVADALKRQFGENGKKYIEKIVQVDYTLPSISKQNLSRIFIDSLSSLFSEAELKEKINEFSDTIKLSPFIGFFTSLRDVYRFNNSLKLRLPSIYNDLNIIDFLLVESLRMFNYDAYEFVILNKETFVYQEKGTVRLNTPSDKGSVSNFIAQLTYDDITKQILNNLFAYNISGFFNSIDPHELIRGKRVCNTNYFDRYFNLQLSSFDIQEVVFENFINGDDLKSSLLTLDKVLAEKKLFGFLNWVEIKSKNSDVGKIKKITNLYLEFSNSVKFNKESIWARDSDYMTILRFVAQMLKRIPDLKDRREVIFNYFKTFKSDFSFSAFYISDTLKYTKNKLDDKGLSNSDFWHVLFDNGFEPLDEKQQEKFVKEIKRVQNLSSKSLLQNQVLDNDFLNEDELACILDFVKQNHSKFYNENFPLLITRDEDLIKLLWMSIKRSYMTANDQIGYQLATYQFFPGMNIKKIKSRISKMDIDSLPEDEKTVIQLFLKAYKDGFQEKRYYNIRTLDIMEY